MRLGLPKGALFYPDEGNDQDNFLKNRLWYDFLTLNFI